MYDMTFRTVAVRTEGGGVRTDDIARLSMNSSTLYVDGPVPPRCYGTRCGVRHFCCVQAFGSPCRIWVGGLCASRFFSRTISQTRCPYETQTGGGWSSRVRVRYAGSIFFSPRDTWTHALPRPVIKFPRYSVSSDTAATGTHKGPTRHVRTRLIASPHDPTGRGLRFVTFNYNLIARRRGFSDACVFRTKGGGVEISISTTATARPVR